MKRVCAAVLALLIATSCLFGDEVAELEQALSTTRREIETATSQSARIERSRPLSVIGLAAGIAGLFGGYALYESGDMLESDIVTFSSLGIGVVSGVGLLVNDHNQRQTSRRLARLRARERQLVADIEAAKYGSPIVVSRFDIDEPESSGDIEIDVAVRNAGSRSLKYVYLTVVPYNRVQDVVIGPGGGEIPRQIEMVGPIEPGDKADQEGIANWGSTEVSFVRVEEVRVVFMDETEWSSDDPEAIAEHLVADSDYEKTAKEIGPAYSSSVVLQSDSRYEWQNAVPEKNAVITIEVTGESSDGEASPFEKNADSVITIAGNRGHGSGFFLSEMGYAITNHHVVVGQSELTAILRNGERVPLRVLRSNSATDSALVEVAVDQSNPVELSADANPQPGSDVIVIGTPLNPALSYTVTKGVISGLRYVESFTLIQTDASVNPGNSGGPLIEEDTGRVLGLVTLKVVSREVEGVAFAVSMSDALSSLGVRIVEE